MYSIVAAIVKTNKKGGILMSLSSLVEVGIISSTALSITFGSIRYLSLKHKHTWVPLDKDSEENPIKKPALRCSECGEIKEIIIAEKPAHTHNWKIIEENHLTVEGKIKALIKIQQCSGCGELKEVRFNA